MFLVLIKALWDLDTRVVMKGARRVAFTLAITFDTAWMGLMGLKSVVDSAPSFFGSEIILV
jgi:hypothetical protein